MVLQIVYSQKVIFFWFKTDSHQTPYIHTNTHNQSKIFTLHISGAGYNLYLDRQFPKIGVFSPSLSINCANYPFIKNKIYVINL